jgi:methylmalonyl-CoA mutase
MNAAIDQQCEKYISEHGMENLVEQKLKEKYDAKGLKRPEYQGSIPEGNNGLGLMLLGVTGDEILSAEVYQEIKERALGLVRGTVQADILKEDQAQNTCIFSTEFSLRLMGDMQQYFIDHKVKNFYSVSISGVSHRRGRCQSYFSTCLYACQWLYVCGILFITRNGNRFFCS